MEAKFLGKFLISYAVVLGGVIGWFVVMFRHAKLLLKRKNT